ncbi:MAG: ATP-binding cassette domain-containing protein [Elusimicrobia bacterium]|nr:ATP-binding cassette domain-containing protein [Elusimicrobiota bacterium]
MDIRVERVSKSYQGARILDRACLAVPSGSLAVLQGANGSGKTSLLEIIAGVVEPDAGEVFLGGRPLKGVPPGERKVFYIPQTLHKFWAMQEESRFCFIPGLTVFENLVAAAAGPSPAGDGPDRRRVAREVGRWLDELRLGDAADESPNRLSVGLQQRLAFARAMLSRPPVLLIDEGLAALDPGIRPRALEIVRRLPEHTGSTVLYVTHDEDEARSIAGSWYRMRKGGVEEVAAGRSGGRRPGMPVASGGGRAAGASRPSSLERKVRAALRGLRVPGKTERSGPSGREGLYEGRHMDRLRTLLKPKESPKASWSAKGSYWEARGDIRWPRPFLAASLAGKASTLDEDEERLPAPGVCPPGRGEAKRAPLPAPARAAQAAPADPWGGVRLLEVRLAGRPGGRALIPWQALRSGLDLFCDPRRFPYRGRKTVSLAGCDFEAAHRLALRAVRHLDGLGARPYVRVVMEAALLRPRQAAALAAAGAGVVARVAWDDEGHNDGSRQGSFDAVLAGLAAVPKGSVGVRLDLAPRRLNGLLSAVDRLAGLGMSAIDLAIDPSQPWTTEDIDGLRQFLKEFAVYYSSKTAGEGRIPFFVEALHHSLYHGVFLALGKDWWRRCFRLVLGPRGSFLPCCGAAPGQGARSAVVRMPDAARLAARLETADRWLEDLGARLEWQSLCPRAHWASRDRQGLETLQKVSRVFAKELIRLAVRLRDDAGFNKAYLERPVFGVSLAELGVRREDCRAMLAEFLAEQPLPEETVRGTGGPMDWYDAR